MPAFTSIEMVGARRIRVKSVRYAEPKGRSSDLPSFRLFPRKGWRYEAPWTSATVVAVRGASLH